MTLEMYKGMMQVLGTAYNKDYKDTELNMLYRYFKNYDEDVFMEAIDRSVTSYDRLPSIKQLTDTCEMTRVSVKLRKDYEALPPITEEDRREFQEILDSFK